MSARRQMALLAAALLLSAVAPCASELPDPSRNIALLALDAERDLFDGTVLLTVDGPVTVADNYALVERVLAAAARRVPPAPADRDGAVAALLAIHRILAAEGFVYEDHDSWEQRLLGHALLHMGLARRRLDCAMYVTLYLGVAERIGLPLAGIGLPGHIALRWRLADGTTFNWEATVPNACDDAFYRAWKTPDAGAVARGVYLRDLSRGEILASTLYVRALVLSERHRPAAALRAVEAAIALASGDPDAHNLRGLLLAGTGDADAALQSFDRAVALDPGFTLARRNRDRVRRERAGNETRGPGSPAPDRAP
ncbi:MAG: hypothetical protein JW819_01805, partial [Candidatus Krumholzibacteriota bacterium]|nr:hypothetical protein [Candidatus Krumholzibacteriota bacterium]